MARVIYCVSISQEISQEIKKHSIRPSDAFKRGVVMFLREKDFTQEDNPLQLKEKIDKFRIALENKCQEYELLKTQYEDLKKQKEGF